MPALEEKNDNVLYSTLKKNPKEIPFFFLYDKKGSDLYEEITKLEEYYPFRSEEKLIKQYIDDVITHVPPYSVVVELGCGTARKTAQVLNALVSRDGSCRFAGIDVSSSFLAEARTNILKQVPGMKTAQVTMVEAEYIQGLEEVRKIFPSENLCVLWLGSSVGNLSNEEAVKFFEDVDAAAGPNMQMLLCTDMWKDREILYAAYHDKEGVTEMFIKNGVRNALRTLGYEASDEEEASWVYEVDVNPVLRRVEMWVRVPRGLNLYRGGIHILPDERILMEVSRKFTVGDIDLLALQSKFCVHAAWRNKKYGMQILIPAEEAVQRCWQDTDSLFATIQDWTAKPIELRHPYGFYMGHLPAFAKLKLFPEEAGSDMETMFSRGIDPIVTDPSRCHSHPETPPEWPSKEETISFVSATRQKILSGVRSKEVSMWVLNMNLEHERMHQETLSYMLAQDKKASFVLQSVNISRQRSFKPKEKNILDSHVVFSPGEVTLGENLNEGGFRWDNEGPPVILTVPHSFSVSVSPVSVGEFHRFVVNEKGYENSELWDAEDFKYFLNRKHKFPATWSLVGGEYYVHGPFTSNHWTEVASQPVFVSLSEAKAYCSSLGARVMTEMEYQRILDSDDENEVLNMRNGGWEWTSTTFEPFPGFQAMPEYSEYSTDFFDAHHFVLKGSSPATHPSMLRDSFRNYFQKEYPFVFAKFRCCRTISS